MSREQVCIVPVHFVSPSATSPTKKRCKQFSSPKVSGCRRQEYSHRQTLVTAETVNSFPDFYRVAAGTVGVLVITGVFLLPQQ